MGAKNENERVYFVRCGARIKVGYTNNLDVRLRAIASQQFEPIIVIGSVAGGRDLELAIHAALADYRIKGEWFYEAEVVNALILRVMANGSEAVKEYLRPQPHQQISPYEIPQGDRWLALSADVEAVGERVLSIARSAKMARDLGVVPEAANAPSIAQCREALATLRETSQTLIELCDEAMDGDGDEAPNVFEVAAAYVRTQIQKIESSLALQ